jgi:hypothetical protein
LLDHLVSTRTRDLAGEMVLVMVETPIDTTGALQGRLEEHLDTLDEGALAAVGDELPPQSFALTAFSRSIAARLVDFARETNALGAERHADAANAFGEGLAIIAPFVDRHVQAFGGLVGALGRSTSRPATRPASRQIRLCWNVPRGRSIAARKFNFDRKRSTREP